MTAKWQYKQAYEAALVTARELRSENAKLREDYDSLAQEHVQTIVELSNSYREEDRLKAENAKLREERDYYKALWEHATVTDCELRRVRAAWKEDREQNAKLRELVKDIDEVADPFLWEFIGRRMRELGIEFDA